MSYRVLPIISAENSSLAGQQLGKCWSLSAKQTKMATGQFFICIYSQTKWLNSVESSRLRPPLSAGNLPKSHWLLRHMAHHHHLIQQGIDFGPGQRCRKHQGGKLWLIPEPNMCRWSVWGTNHTKHVLCPIGMQTIIIILFWYILDCVKVCHIL